MPSGSGGGTRLVAEALYLLDLAIRLAESEAFRERPRCLLLDVGGDPVARRVGDELPQQRGSHAAAARVREHAHLEAEAVAEVGEADQAAADDLAVEFRDIEGVGLRSPRGRPA